ncbi:MAG TPA: glycosyltransferase family A protein [Solirubrobacteraceae bacterium]
MRESDITVVIPARDAAAVLPATLGALAGADVVVVDNGSRDDTAAVALAHGARVVHEPRANRARARNAGAKATSAPLLAFLDADCVPSERWLAALTEALADAELAAGPVEWRSRRRPNRIERFDVAWRTHARRTGGFSGSGNLAVRREAFDRLGGFDPAFRAAGEDSDLARRAGSAVRFVPDAVVAHAAERSVRGLVARGFRHGEANVQMRRRFGPDAGRAYWRHPKPLVAGDWAIRRFGIDDRSLLPVARLDYAARMAGSLWATARRVR